MTASTTVRVGLRALVVALLVAGSDASAQFAERASLAGSGEPDVDVSGRSIKNPRIKAIHTTDADLEGGTLYLMQKDPFLAYQLGRNLNFREFRPRDGVYFYKIGNKIGWMPDTHTRKITAMNQNSCTSCHNQPYGTPGGGINFSKDSGFNRNSPHYFGGGILEMLGLQIRQEILNQVDTNGDGWISIAESYLFEGTIKIQPNPFSDQVIDLGSPRLSEDFTGVPDQLNNIIRAWYVGNTGREVQEVYEVDPDLETYGYNFMVVTFGWGQGPTRVLEDDLGVGTPGEPMTQGNALNPTLRTFYWDPAFTHSGMTSHDPSTFDDPNLDGMSEPTLAGMGAPQFPATHEPIDEGIPIFSGPGYGGYSIADPDVDLYKTEISEGDLDLAEWFMLNAPRPAFAGTTGEYQRGITLMTKLGCTECHVPNWEIKKFDGSFDGDRRFFDFDVTWNETNQRLEGEVVMLTNTVGDKLIPRRDAFSVRGIFTDMIQHDMGPGFAELAFDGSVNTTWRTAPLWGVGSGFPWGHDGRSLTLRDAILRHDGEGAAARSAFERAGGKRQRALIDFLEKLVLYDIEGIPADVDGDGAISENFVVAGMNTGTERFNAEWLFNTPLQIQGPVLNAEGEMITSFAGVNIPDAYGLDLEFRVDADEDGWPDKWDPNPNVQGFKDGINN